MTPQRAKTLAGRWLIAALAVLVIRTALDMVGIDLMSMPLQAVTAVFLMLSMHHSGWAKGYWARDKETP